jgi:hypothetical protein
MTLHTNIQQGAANSTETRNPNYNPTGTVSSLEAETPLSTIDGADDHRLSSFTQSVVTKSAFALSQQQRTRRGADTRYDRLSTRHHVICLAGVLADQANGGYDEARAIEARQEKPIRPRVPHKDVAQICPWVINAAYINLQGSLGLAQKGLDRSFKDWLANRVYFFSYRLPNKSEHPAQRARGISSIYKKFYDTFSEDISAKVLISEERAKAFWKSVAAQVPYLWPEPVVGESSVNLVAKEGGSHE